MLLLPISILVFMYAAWLVSSIKLFVTRKKFVLFNGTVTHITGHLKKAKLLNTIEE